MRVKPKAIVHSESYWTSFYTTFLKPGLEACGFEVRRSEDKPGKITKEIVQDLAYCDLVLAVLTDDNPNVWYELGIRHSSRIGTIMILEKGQKPRFDVQDYGILFYLDSDPGQFKKDLERHLINEPRKDNPVADFLKIGPNISVNAAVAGLRRTSALIKMAYSEGGRVAAIAAVSAISKTFPAEVQVTVVELGSPCKYVFHRDVDLAADPMLGWLDFLESGKSFLVQMLADRDGVALGRVKDIHGRLTAIAFETMETPPWLVVAEGHYRQRGSRPYE